MTCACASALYAGCSDDPLVGDDVAVDGSDATPPDAFAPPNGGDAEADAHVCADEPFDCSPAADAGDAGVTSLVPENLRCTSLYACWSDKTVRADHRAYAPAFTLWSDGAEKQRWLFLPPGQQIDTGTPDEWRFPVGTMVYKEFKLAGKRVETRRIWKASATAWVFSVWRWSSDESTATLVDAGATIPNAAIPGAVYEIPATSSCAGCHDGHADKLLSVDAWSLAAPGATGATLTQLKADARLSFWPYPTTFATPEDGTGKLAKAIGFYYANCSFCHKAGRPGGNAGLRLDLPVGPALPVDGGGLPDGGAGIPFGQTPLYLTAVNVAHVNMQGIYPPATYKRITRGKAAASVVVARDVLRDADGGIAPGQMPNILQRTVDPKGIEATTSWINALPQ